MFWLKINVHGLSDGKKFQKTANREKTEKLIGGAGRSQATIRGLV